MLDYKNQTIAIIDSGIGGISILRQLIDKYKCGNYIYFADNLYMPYGNKTHKWLNNRIRQIVDILKQKYKVRQFILACNTASACLDFDCSDITKMRFDETKIYFATKLTKKNLPNMNVIADLTLAKQIEINILNHKQIDRIIKRHVKLHNLNHLNEFVLGCTHYELVKDYFLKYCPKSKIVNNSELMIDFVKIENTSTDELNVVIMLSQKNKNLEDKIMKLIRR